MSLTALQLAGAVANWRLVVGDYVPEKHESVTLADAWLERLALAVRAAGWSAQVTDRVFLYRYRPQFRLKPMSLTSINLYRSAQVLASHLPLCPDLGLLPRLRLEDEEFSTSFGVVGPLSVVVSTEGGPLPLLLR
jgi:hypothetical protein